MGRQKKENRKTKKQQREQTENKQTNKNIKWQAYAPIYQ